MPSPPDLNPELGFEASLRMMVKTVAREIIDEEWGEILPAVMMLRRHEPEMAAVLEQDHGPKMALLERVLRQGEDEGLLVRGLDRELVATILIGPLVFSSITQADQDGDTLADHVVDQFMAANRPGSAHTSR